MLGEFGAPRPDASNPLLIAWHEFNVTKNTKQRITSARLLSQMVMAWGQFVAHDTMATPSRTGEVDSAIKHKNKVF